MEGNNTEPKVNMVENRPEPKKGGIGEDILMAVKENWKSWVVTGLLAAGTFAAGWWYGKQDAGVSTGTDAQDDAPFDVGAETTV